MYSRGREESGMGKSEDRKFMPGNGCGTREGAEV